MSDYAVFTILHGITWILYHVACFTAGFWAGDVIGSLITHERPTKEHALNLLCAVLLALSCSTILWLCY